MRRSPLLMSPRALLWLVALALALALAAFAWTGYPPPSTDAPGFLVSAINLARGNGLVNPLYMLATLADPSGQRRHVYHAPLFPVVVAALMPWPTPQGAFLAIAFLRAASLLLCAWWFSKLIDCCGGAERWPESILGAASLCGLATHWIPTVGRSEALATLFVLLAALAPFHLAGSSLLLGFGTLAGALAATHPFGGVELVAVVGLYYAARHDTRRWLRLWTALILLSLVTFFALLAASPHGLRDSLDGMSRALPATPWLVLPTAEGWKAWMTSRGSTFYGPLVILSLACGIRLLKRPGRKLGSPVGFAICATLLAGCFYLGSLTFRSLRNYNFLLLAPLLFGLVLAWRCDSSARTPTPRRRAAHAIAFGLVLATAAGFFGRLAALPVFLQDYRSLEQAREAWRRFELPENARVALVGNLWTLSEDYGRMEAAPYRSERQVAARGRVLVLAQQAEHGGRAPRLDGFVKVVDLFNPKRGSRRDLLALFLEEDYAFAAYLPQPARR